ncbi:hypothetical protein [Streptomyces hiroshimensis]|uniref:SH3 domain-containing protein n=1 Tax=Streptomyces hiroshimensis TaxID=66424 RepID=A0ABQ2Y455_9ACTN|nr:hypothetical protein [Streptomyces hiroshimensis]GGX63496.1 hypothetical protein GCM10010324_05310 [Streptomyces hiroshimensis]
MSLMQRRAGVFVAGRGVVVLGVLFAFCASAGAGASADGGGAGGGVPGEVISRVGQKVRKSPAISAPAVGSYKPGAHVLIACQAAGGRVDGDGLWYRLADGRGWLSARYVHVSGFVPVCKSGGGSPGGPAGPKGEPAGQKGQKGGPGQKGDPGQKGGPGPSAPTAPTGPAGSQDPKEVPGAATGPAGIVGPTTLPAPVGGGKGGPGSPGSAKPGRPARPAVAAKPTGAAKPSVPVKPAGAARPTPPAKPAGAAGQAAPAILPDVPGAAGRMQAVARDYTVPPRSLRQLLRSPTCPDGTRIAGGGYFQPGGRIGGVETVDAYPSVTGNVYLVGVNNTSPTAVGLRVFAVCQPVA